MGIEKSAASKRASVEDVLHMRKLSDRVGFVVATAGFLLLFAASAAPVPLYSLYQASAGLTDSDISLTMFTYLLGVVPMLMFAGTLSDAVGRRPLTMVALTLGGLGCVLFLNVANATTLLFARFVQGIACGLAMGPVSAYVVDLAGRERDMLARTIVGCGSMVGITLGSITMGLITSITPHFSLVYCVIAVLLAINAVIIVLMPETALKAHIPIRTMLRAGVSVPKSVRGVFPIAAVAYISTWSFGTFFQSFSAPVALIAFNDNGTVLAAIVLSLAMSPSAFAAPLEARIPQRISLRVGMTLFLISAVGLCLFMHLGALVPFLAFEALFSVAMGICLSASLRLLFAASAGESSTTIVSSINLAAYAGCTVMSIATSALVAAIPLIGVLIALTAFALAATVACFVLAKR